MVCLPEICFYLSGVVISILYKSIDYYFKKAFEYIKYPPGRNTPTLKRLLVILNSSERTLRRLKLSVFFCPDVFEVP